MKKIILTLSLLVFLCPVGFSADENTKIILEEKTETQATNAEEFNLQAAREMVNKVLEQQLPKAKVDSIERFIKDGKNLIKCNVSYGGTSIYFIMDPETGKISDITSNQGSFVLDRPELVTTKAGVQLTAAQVNKILNKTIPGAKVKKVKYDKKNSVISGYAGYEGLEYYFEIDTIHGNIIKMEPAK